MPDTSLLTLALIAFGAWSLLVSIVTFALYGWDKRQAKRGGGRVPEKRLHLFELLGGWPGAWFAQRLFRHKTVKTSYRLVFFAIVLLHTAVWAGLIYVWWRSEKGG